MKKIALFLQSNINDILRQEIEYSQETFNKLSILKEFLLNHDKLKALNEYRKYSQDEVTIKAITNFPKPGTMKDLHQVISGLDKNLDRSMQNIKKFREVLPFYLQQNKINIIPQYRTQLIKNKLL